MSDWLRLLRRTCFIVWLRLTRKRRLARIARLELALGLAEMIAFPPPRSLIDKDMMPTLHSLLYEMQGVVREVFPTPPSPADATRNLSPARKAPSL